MNTNRKQRFWGQLGSLVLSALLIAIWAIPWLVRGDIATAWAKGAESAVAAPLAEANVTTIPTAFSYQGTLRLADGSLATGAFNVTLNIYDSVTGGNVLHSESFANTVARNGSFSVIVGDSTAINPAVFQNTNLYLGITVAPDPEMLPRQRLLPVPWAMQAGTAATLQLGAQGYGIVPIGAILPWHKSLAGTPALPVGWVECNGQKLDDPQSPLHGQVIPNLNGPALFIRGGATSGVFQQDQMQSHKHLDAGHLHGSHDTNGTHTPKDIDDTSNEYGFQIFANTDIGYAILGDPSQSTAGPARHGSETRPVNISMVWIMRVK